MDGTLGLFQCSQPPQWWEYWAPLSLTDLCYKGIMTTLANMISFNFKNLLRGGIINST